MLRIYITGHVGGEIKKKNFSVTFRKEVMAKIPDIHHMFSVFLFMYLAISKMNSVFG